MFLFFGIKLFSQPFNNEWIVFSQKYYKIKIAKNGLYKIDSAAMAAAGIPVSTINPKKIQLFHKGKEIYPYIFGENDGVLNTNDYILFYAEKNTCKDDSLYFDKIPYLSNPYYSVINDTAAVFLTWNGSTSNKRLTLNTDTTYSQNIPSPYYYKEIITGIAASYSPGPLNFLNLSDPRYKQGEGFIDGQIYETQAYNLSINTSALYAGGPLVYFTICLSGANNIGVINTDHYIQNSYTDNTGTPVIVQTDSIDAYDTRLYNYSVSPSVLGASTTVACSSLVNSATTISNYTNINYMRALLPQQFNMLNTSEEKMMLPDSASFETILNKQKEVARIFLYGIKRIPATSSC